MGVEPNLRGTLTRFGISISGIVYKSLLTLVIDISELIYRVLLKGNMYTFMCREGDDFFLSYYYMCDIRLSAVLSIQVTLNKLVLTSLVTVSVGLRRVCFSCYLLSDFAGGGCTGDCITGWMKKFACTRRYKP